MTKKTKPDDLVSTGDKGPIELTDNDMDAASGGMNRVKTSDKQQKAVLDFVKG